MKSLTPSGVVLALAPTARGFGFIAFSDARTPLDWGVKEARRDKQEDCYLKMRILIHVMQPGTLVLEDARDPASRRSRRLRDLIDRIGRFATDHGVATHRYARRAVNAAFRVHGATNKDTIAAAIASLVPELAPRRPRRRKIWESEHYSMAIFDAAALALTHFNATPDKESN